MNLSQIFGKNSNQPVQKKAAVSVEGLEDRFLMATSLYGSTMTTSIYNNYSLDYGVYGTNYADNISIDYGYSAAYWAKPVRVTVKNSGGVVIKQQTFWSMPSSGLVIRGLGGDDTIVNNTNHAMKIYGGYGNDTVYGGGGTDRIYGESGDDFLDGRGGTDYLYGGANDDELHGGTGSDYLYGNGGHDFLNGASREAAFAGGRPDGAKDYLYGGSGADEFQQYTYVPCYEFGCDTEDAKEEDNIRDFNLAEGDSIINRKIET